MENGGENYIIYRKAIMVGIDIGWGVLLRDLGQVTVVRIVGSFSLVQKLEVSPRVWGVGEPEGRRNGMEEFPRIILV